LETKGIKIIETPEEKEVLQILVDYLKSIEYWSDPDNGVWEEYEEIHASSVGACVAGLKSISKTGLVSVSHNLIEKGEEALKKILPRESTSKFTDLALLSLIYPFNIVDSKMKIEILRHLEYHLERDRGVIRYKNDRYYNKNEDGTSEEAEWCFGFPWLSIIYSEMHKTSPPTPLLDSEEGRKNQQTYLDKAHEYLEKSYKTIYNDQIPELYYSDSDLPNENTPLGWAESLFVVALLKAGR
jgi:phosphorylase kinase alpha/beta subunit